VNDAGKKETVKSTTGGLFGVPDSLPAGDLPLDVEKYRAQMKESDLSEEQQVEFLQALWSIMKAFVEIGFNANSIQNFMPELAPNPSETGADRVKLEDRKYKQRFEKAALGSAAEGGNS